MYDYDRMTDFWFYEEFMEYVYRAPPSAQGKLLYKIIEYGTEGRVDISDVTDPFSRAVLPQIKASIDASRRRHEEAVLSGKRGGRPKKIWSKEFIEEFQYMVVKNYPVKEIAKHFEISLSTAYRYIKQFPLEKAILDARESGGHYSIGVHQFYGEIEMDIVGFSSSEEDKRGPVPLRELAYMERLRHEQEVQEQYAKYCSEHKGKLAYENMKWRNMQKGG